MKNKTIAIFMILILIFQIFSPIFSYATTEEKIIDEKAEEILENIETEEEQIDEMQNEETVEEDVDNEIKKNEIVEEELIENEVIEEQEDVNIENEIIEEQEETIENTIIEEEANLQEEVTEVEEETVIEDIIAEELITENITEEENEVVQEEIMPMSEDNGIMLLGAGDIYVGNEAEFRNALALGADVIHVRQSINFSTPVYINYPVTIVDESDDNALRYYGGGSFLVIQNGGHLTISGMVIDGNSAGTSGVTMINIENGGNVTFVNSSIVDGGIGNTGILINGGGYLLLWSSHIVRCGLGINLQTNGQLYFATQEGRVNDFYWNNTAIFIDNFYGSVDLNQNISMHDNSEFGVYIGNSSGNINISAGDYYNNTYCIHTRNITGGNVTVSGGNYHNNGWAIWVGGNLNLTGGSIYSNYYGVLTDGTYSGNFTMIGGSIYSNSSHAIQHQKGNDGGCTILGGAISGDVYLANNDNYVNTNTSYPTFTVTPSTYWFKRKLVKTNSNAYAKNEISKITLTPNGSWYKYVENGSQYIVLWNGGNVIVRCKDYYGNILKTVTMNGTIGSTYSVSAPSISGYDFISAPSNAKGTYTQADIIVELKYDIVNVAKVNFADLLSGVVSAKYWYNGSSQSFSGNGTSFTDGTIFEKYGYYKVTVVNGVGLEKTITFTLNKNSLKR